MENKCSCGDKKCPGVYKAQGLKIKSKPVESNKMWKLKHKRSRPEMWLDQYNHIMELMRTVVQFIVLILQFYIIARLTQ